MAARAFAVEFDMPPSFAEIAQAVSRETGLATSCELPGESMARLYVADMPTVSPVETGAAGQPLRLVLFGPDSDPAWILRIRGAMIGLGGRSTTQLAKWERALLEEPITREALAARELPIALAAVTGG